MILRESFWLIRRRLICLSLDVLAWNSDMFLCEVFAIACRALGMIGTSSDVQGLVSTGKRHVAGQRYIYLMSVETGE